jgi:phthalate 4,5-cis-dihydrodiol dehydrogenase
MENRILGVGAVGLGRAFMLMLPTFVADSRVRLVAAADPDADARARFVREFGGQAYASVADLCADPAVEVVYIATPHEMHAEHVRAAAAAGKHVLVEKPIAITLAQCETMIEAAQRAGVYLIVGHSHSFNEPILRARDIIVSGEVGAVQMITALNFTDFLYRPRRPEELETQKGGGVVFSQASHQVDIVRLLGGGRVRSVRAVTGNWDKQRSTEGAYSGLLTFEDGAFASLTYSGYAHFDSDELLDWIGEMGERKDAARYGHARRAVGGLSSDEEAALKRTRTFAAGVTVPVEGGRQHQQFGTVIVSCEHADLRPTARGVAVYGDVEKRFDALPPPAVPRGEVIDELYDAVVHGHPPLHSGAWAMATLEVCLAILQSAREGRDVMLAHQIGLAVTSMRAGARPVQTGADLKNQI